MFPSAPNATNEVDVAAQFLGFWKNFVDTFDLNRRKVYISGESYAGNYVSHLYFFSVDVFLPTN
jgi:carboxypeptidase D